MDPGDKFPPEERLQGHKSIVFKVLPHLLVKGAATDRSQSVVSMPLLPCSSRDCFSPYLSTFFSSSLVLTHTHAELAKQVLVSFQALLYVVPCLGQGLLYFQLSLQQGLFSLSTWSESRVQKVHSGF